MLEKPDIPDEMIVSSLQSTFSLDVCELAFLPIGADADTAVYRAANQSSGAFFVKLRRGENAAISVEIARALHDQGVEHAIPPLTTDSGALWCSLDPFTVSVAPFISGQDGFSRELSDDNLIELGRALRKIHDAQLPESLAARLPGEDYSSYWRAQVRSLQQQAENGNLPDQHAEELAAMIRRHRELISRLLDHAERLAAKLVEKPLAEVPCHADIHAGNVLVDDTGRLYIVDWDTFMLAPKERDLMFIGGGISSDWRGSRHEQLFYRGYGTAVIDLDAIAYYRCERILQDVAAFGAQLFLSSAGGADREQAVHYFASNFQPGSTIDIALESVRRART